ncbi:MAG: GxxExxY protein [Caldilineaceae bacterium]|nr:GxxExxY protein [Caldilineaceae bacterium]
MGEMIFPELSYAVQGSFFDVNRQLRGVGLSEEGWERALHIALTARGICAQRQVAYELKYGEHRIGRFFVDMIVEDKMLLELKATARLLPIHFAQVITYLRVTGLDLGILVNFGGNMAEFERILRTTPSSSPQFIAPPIQSSDVVTDLFEPELTRAIRGVLYQVHAFLRPGYMHMHYRRATQIELRAQGIGVQYRTKIMLAYLGHPIETKEVKLLIVEGKILVACVAVSVVTEAMRLRMRHYLRLLNMQLGLIANFHAPNLEIISVRVAPAG